MRTMVAIILAAAMAGQAKDNTPPEGFVALWNGKDLTGWQGLVELPKRDKDPEKYAAQIKAANEKYLPHWTVKDGVLCYDGKGQSLQTVKDYGDFEMMVDWKIGAGGDSGIYVRGTPQIQIWDPAKHNGIGSGGLYNNIAPNPSNPIKKADKPIGEWNSMTILMKGDKVTVHLNGELVVDNTPLDNYWGRPKDPKANPPLPAKGPIELQHHGDHLEFKNIYIKELN